MGYQLRKKILASEIADSIGASLMGEDIEVSHVAPLTDVQLGGMAFSKTGEIPSSVKDALIISARDNPRNNVSLMISPEPRLAFMRALAFLDKAIGFIRPDKKPMIHESARISSSAFVGNDVKIGANSNVGHFVVINDGVQIGDNCVIKSGAVIGEDGFGFERDEDGRALRFIHLGSVRIGDNVEIGSLTTVCRGTLGDTVIEDGAKIDDHVHIAHNCHIGRHSLVIACAEVSGGVKLGQKVWVGPNASIIQQIRVGDNSLIGIGANVLRDVLPDETVVGNPAKPLKR